ncbi:exocyst subunit exo70 family protein C1 [Raphanus sativus]|uniref:Exocyst subunit Exo70 family protein n=1 Tax=Raphanus sativus TaxID=3726 RepID=A0A6J0KAJ7_RAPSA|nr:exocyst complex component EXO70B1-like [Raphanus sativus]KAJ4882924.1 exocyst subunit exo70 family protein C1 [Raphanus sativus]
MEKPGDHATESETLPHKSNDLENTNHSHESEHQSHNNDSTEKATPESESESESSQLSLTQVMEAVDDFIQSLSSSTDPLQEIPPAVEPFPETVDSLVSKMESSGLGRDETEDSAFIDAVNRISISVMRLRELNLDSTPVSSWLNRASSVQHHAVSLLDEEFRHLLDRSIENNNKKKNDHDESDNNDEREDAFPDFPPESIATLKKIAGAMISAGYETECCMSYETSRRHAFKEELSGMGYEGIVNNVEDVQRIPWESLQGEIASWISIVRRCSSVLLPGEISLCNAVLPEQDHAKIRKRLLTGFLSTVTIRFLDFSGAVVLTKRSSEKLFKFLDMYETLRELALAVEQSDSDLIHEIKLAQTRLGEAAVTIFGELENSIKTDIGRTPVPSGAVHPLTRYTMNYLKYACEYKDTLDQVFQHYEKAESDQTEPEPENQREDDEEYKTSAFARQMIRVMELLDANLEIKSALYRDPSLRSIFLMNNGRYILQKIKGSTEIRDLMGQAWTRKRSTELRQYHKSYQRETWGKVLQCMNQEGLQVNGKVSKTALKERFKIFNNMFDEIHKTQSTWIVNDEQMQSELRVSIAALVIPAYRSFFGRYKQHIDSGRHTDKYVKYQPEDIESVIDDLFDGNPASMGRKRT